MNTFKKKLAPKKGRKKQYATDSRLGFVGEPKREPQGFHLASHYSTDIVSGPQSTKHPLGDRGACNRKGKAGRLAAHSL